LRRRKMARKMRQKRRRRRKMRQRRRGVSTTRDGRDRVSAVAAATKTTRTGGTGELEVEVVSRMRNASCDEKPLGRPEKASVASLAAPTAVMALAVVSAVG
jgi:hypothetical protein